MKDALARWIADLKNWLNPHEIYRAQYAHDELFQGRRSALRRNRSLTIRRYSILISCTVIVILIISSIFWGIGHMTHASKIDTIQNNIGKLYSNDKHADLKSSVTKSKLTNLKKDIDKIKNKSKTKELVQSETKAQNAYQVYIDYHSLYNQQGHLKASVTTKNIDTQIKHTQTMDLEAAFQKNYQNKLQTVKKIAILTEKLDKRYQELMDAHKNNISIRDSTIEKLLKDMKKNQKSQKTLDEQTKLISLKTTVHKENQAAEQAAKDAAAKAEAESQAEQQSQEAASSSSVVTSAPADNGYNNNNYGTSTDSNTGSYYNTGGYYNNYNNTNRYQATTPTSSSNTGYAYASSKPIYYNNN